jgi:receptor protein-tyrosine kinase
MIDLRDLPRMLRRGRRWIVVITALAIAVALAWVVSRSPAYTSHAQVEVRPLTVDEQLQPLPSSESFVNMNTEAARVTQEPVAQLAASAMGSDARSPAGFAAVTEGVRVTVEPSTTYLDISCTESDAEQARRCADAFAQAYVEDRVNGARNLFDARTKAELDKIRQATNQIKALRSQLSEPGSPRESIRSQIEAENGLIAAARTNLITLPTASPDAAVLARPADLPTSPSNKHYVLIVGLAAFLGLALGIGFAIFRERLVEPIAERQNLEAILEAPVLASVPDLTLRRGTRDSSLVTEEAPDSQAAQAYMAAAAGLLHIAREEPIQVIAVTGPGQGEGKTTTTANLAVVLAQGGSRVVTISCDLRNPRLHALFDRSNDVGLTSLLTGHADIDEALQATELPDLFLIASGPVSNNPAHLLGSDVMGRLIGELRTSFDFMILDTSPGLVIADVVFLVPQVDGFIVLSDAVRTSRTDVADLRSQLEAAGGRVVGGILTNVMAKRAQRARYGPAGGGLRRHPRRRSEQRDGRPSDREGVRTEAGLPGGSPEDGRVPAANARAAKAPATNVGASKAEGRG